MNGKKETLYLYLKKTRNKTSKTIIQSLLFQSAVWFLNILYTVYAIHFCDNNKFSGKQSRFRFRTGDSCVNQLPSIIHGNFTSFDNGLEVRGVFLDVSRALNVWHDGLKTT